MLGMRIFMTEFTCGWCKKLKQINDDIKWIEIKNTKEIYVICKECFEKLKVNEDE